ncbi:helix-turn-helix transcriptional regulator [Thalassospira sp.]|uniref:helix-turn-helix transcriptional regulator n=1 Tax=Thalassospira sp. TaxID=1912094 RepID=UPI00273590CA|nr:helix-turn-helix transcriptional regulator [Thalassospira sp.]MDP2699408.1 helix-turn-helix transcriptional regulator [Thalassospira sp.]
MLKITRSKQDCNMPDNFTILHDGDGVPIAVTMSFDAFRKFAPDIAEGYLSDEALAALAAKEDDGTRYPYELAQRMMAGDHPVRIFREWRDMTQTELADKAGVAGNYISMIERGRNVPSRKLQLALAKALDVDYDMLETGPSFKAE